MKLIYLTEIQTEKCTDTMRKRLEWWEADEPFQYFKHIDQNQKSG